MSELPGRRLPAAAEFSPGQIKLREVLQLVAEHAGDRRAIVEAIRQKYFSGAAERRLNAAERLEQQTKRAGNVLIGMASYGVFDPKTSSLTEIGARLAATENDVALNEGFAEHILKTTPALDVLRAVRDIQSRGQRVTKASLHTELSRLGFSLPTATTHHTQLLNWLELSGVVDTGHDYAINDEVTARLSGVTLTVLDELMTLTNEQRAFLATLRGLAEAHQTDPLRTQEVFEASKRQHGAIFKEDQLSSRVLRPLEQRGWITLSGREGGRGGKSGNVAATPKLLDVEPGRLGHDSGEGIPADLRAKLRTPLSQIYAGLVSDSTHEKGLALELLALRLVVDLGLSARAFRHRSSDTSGSEVDLIAEGVHLHFSRWVIQCKNTASVGMSAFDKEVGMAIRTRGHVIMLVTTGHFTETVKQAARDLARDTNLQAVLLDSEALERYKAGGMSTLVEMLRAQARGIMAIKREQVPAKLIE